MTGYQALRLGGILAAIAVVLIRLQWGWPSGHVAARVLLLAAVAWLAGRIGQWVDDSHRRGMKSRSRNSGEG